MKIIKSLSILLAVLIVIFFVTNLFLPSKYEVSESIYIETTAAIPFALINQTSGWEQWSPWIDTNNRANYTFNGPKSGVGASILIKSGNDLTGELKCIESSYFDKIAYKLSFENSHASISNFRLKEHNNKTLLTWSIEGEFGFLKRWMNLFTKNYLRPDLLSGLQRIKKQSELLAQANLVFNEVDLPERYFLVVRDSAKHDDMVGISNAYSNALQEILEFVKLNNITTKGNPVSINLEYETNFVFEAGLPINTKSLPMLTGRVKLIKMPASRVIIGIYKGPYSLIGPSYSEIFNYMIKQEYKLIGSTWEEYINDPSSTAPSDLITHIHFPVVKVSSVYKEEIELPNDMP